MFAIEDDCLQQAKQCQPMPESMYISKKRSYNNKNRGTTELCLKGDKLLKGGQ
jgi:hypothetical protein